MQYLVLDTETSGLLNGKFVSFTDLDNCPKIKQIAWQLLDNDGKLIKEENIFIDFENENSNLAIKPTIDKLLADIRCYDPILIGHNIQFDKKIIGAEILRQNIYNLLIDQKYICTMEQTVEFCAFPNYKYPKLQELHFKLFGAEFEGAHDALNDVNATVKCFLKLKNDGINLEPQKDYIYNYPSYNEYIEKIRSNIKNSIYKRSALVELLRLFRKMPAELEIEDELKYLNENYLKVDYNENFKLPDDNDLTEIRKNFYLFKEKEFTDLFQLNDKFNKFEDEDNKKGIKPQIGRTLLFYSVFNENPTVKDDFKGIAKEYQSYIYEYELWLISNKREHLDNSKGKPNIYMQDVLESMRSKIVRNEIDLTKFVGFLYSLYPEVIYDSNLKNRDNAITGEIDELEKTIKLIKPRLNEIQIILYLRFLITLESYIPAKFKYRITNLREYLIKKEGCYIATLCYGSYNCPEVMLFREFRDDVLMNNYLGKLFVEIYYYCSIRIVVKLKKYSLIHKIIRIIILNPIYSVLLVKSIINKSKN